jgi:hypothetical protein
MATAVEPAHPASPPSLPEPAPPRRVRGIALIVAGLAVSLGAVVGGLIVQLMGSESALSEPSDPWRLALFGGLALAAVGGIRWAVSLHSDFGGLIGAGLVMLLASALALAGWAAWDGRGGTVAASGGGGVASSGGGVVPAGSSAAGDGHVEEHAAVDGGSEGASFTGNHHGEAGPTTPEQAQVLAQQLDAAKTATERYRDIEVARRDGFVQVTQFIPGLGLHLARIGRLNRPFDPAEPALLLYMPEGANGMRLAGVAYDLPHTTDTPPEGFAGGSDVWHFHKSLCFLLDGTVTITPDEAACSSRSGIFQAETGWLLHAWLYVENPNGVFVEQNPAVF